MSRYYRWLLLRALFLVCFVVASCEVASAQGLGAIVGTVADPSGAAMAAARLKLTDTATSVSREASTGAEGYFVFEGLRPSTYSLSVEAKGFASSVRQGILLQADQTVTVNVALTIGPATESVTIDAQLPQVNTSTSTVSEVVEQRRIVDLPLNGRNAASLTLLAPGVVLGPAGADEGSTKTFPAAVTMSANGARQNQNSYRLDGASNNDIYTNVNQPFPFPDALQEFSVQTSNYTAKYGGSAGAVINVVTRSGSNEVHGAAFDFTRNAVFNARNFFASNRDQLKRNQFGGTLGGPIIIPNLYNGKDRTFFFAGYQGTRRRNDGAPQSAYFPTSGSVQGDFSEFSTIYDPLTCGTANKLSTCTPFSGNQIPTERLDPAAIAYSKLLPATPGLTRTFYATPVSENMDEMISRIDHNLSSSDRLTGRYFFDRYEKLGMIDPKNYVRQTPYSLLRSHNVMLNETHTFSPNLFNDFYFSVARQTSARGPGAGSINAADLGVAGMYMPEGEKVIQVLQVSGYFKETQSSPSRLIRTQYNLSDSLYWNSGAHSVSIGFEAVRGWLLIRNQYNAGGNWTFSKDATGNALASFALGKVRTFRQGNGEYFDNRVNRFSLYVQDDWRVSRRLTLNLGLRYDPYFPWKETKGRVAVFKTDAYADGVTSKMFVNAPAGLLFPGDTGVPKYGVYGAMKNFAPRVGFAYDVFGDGKTSLRGGAGMFFDAQQNGSYGIQIVDQSPFSTLVGLTDPKGPFSNPYLGIANPFPAPYPPPKDIEFPSPTVATTFDTGHGSHFQTPVIYGWNLSVERQLSTDLLLRLAYVGSHGSHLQESLELSPTIYNSNGARYFKEYGSITAAAQDINSSYNSLQVTLEKRFSKGLSVLANYTWAKSIDDMPFGQASTSVYPEGLSPIPWYMPGRHQFDRGPSEFDHTHRLTTSFVWETPKLAHAPKAVRAILGNWQMSGILSAQTGGPVTVMVAEDRSGTALASDRGVLLSKNVYGAGACGNSVNCVDYLNPAAFGIPEAGTFGNLGKGALRGPNQITYDAGLFKEIPLKGDRVRLQFRAEAFNLFNRVNFYNPGDSNSRNDANNGAGAAMVDDAGFGAIVAAFDPRIGQIGVKLVF